MHLSTPSTCHAFFFVAGVFVRRSAARRGTWGFVAQKLRTIVYPFLLWSTMLTLAETLTSRFMDVRPPPVRLSLLNVLTGNIAWFLPALFVALVLAMLLRRFPEPLLLLGSCVAAFLWPQTHIAALDAGVAHLPFVVAGMWLGGRVRLLERLPAATALALALMSGAMLFVAASQVTSLRGQHLGFLPAGFVGTGVLLLLERSLQGTLAERWTAWVGVASLGVFLLSPYLQGAGRLLLMAAHIRQPVVQLLLPTLTAIFIPAWTYHWRDRLRIGWLFAWPWGSAESTTKLRGLAE